MPTPTELVASFDLGRGPPTALLIHGFTGNPFEVRPLGEHLAAKGFRAIGVRLPGHGLDPFELERTTAGEWIAEARAALFSVPSRERVFVAGLSMGALIAAILAADHPDKVSAVAFCAPALAVTLRRKLRAVLARVGLSPRFHQKKPSTLKDEQMRDALPRLKVVPNAAALEFDKVRALARLAAPRVQAPSLLLYSTADQTVPAAAALQMGRLLGDRLIRTVRLTESSHVLTADLERERVAVEIEQFFRAAADRRELVGGDGATSSAAGSRSRR